MTVGFGFATPGDGTVELPSFGRIGTGALAGLKADDGHGGTVTPFQRLGSAATLSIHLHCLVLDGVYRRIAFGPRAGQKVLTMPGEMPRDKDFRQVVLKLKTAWRNGTTHPAACETNYAHHRPVCLIGAKLLKRGFVIEMEHWPNCGGELKNIAVIPEQPVIGKILTHLELQARAPSRAAARGQALQAA